MANEGTYASVLSSPIEEIPPAYESGGWARDVEIDEKESETRRDWKSQSQWVDAYIDAPRVFNDAIDRWRKTAWTKRGKAITAEQIIAFFLVVTFGIVPFILLGKFTRGKYVDGPPFRGVFEDKVQNCGYSFGTPENATIKGVEKLFVLDQTFGSFTFAQVKTIDIVWDVVIGRGIQLVAWWVGYVVFSDALLRAIERHPASFQIFQRIALEGPSLLSLWTLIKELWGAKSKRTKALFFYFWIATLYIISIPMFVSAMTGYDSTSIPWVSLDDSNNIVQASTLKMSFLAAGTWDELWKEEVCMDVAMSYNINSAINTRQRYCDCQLPNGTITNSQKWSGTTAQMYSYSYPTLPRNCRFDFPGANGTFKDTYFSSHSPGNTPTEQCASSFNITANSQTYDATRINGTTGYCYASKPYHFGYLQDRSRCLPDTAHPSYEWGFSTMLSGLFVFFHFAWSLSMYAVWQDAQWHSSLIKSGYAMTPLRAAFAMAKAAKRRTGMGGHGLVRADTKELEQELYGKRGRQGTCVEFGTFEEDEEEGGGVRRRVVRPKEGRGDEIMEVEVGAAESSSDLGTVRR